MSVRTSADQAGWTIREAAWGFEERVIWRGSDATSAALARGCRALEPLQRLIQTRLTWPLSDAFRARSTRTQAAIAASATVAALATATAGAITAVDRPAAPTPTAAAPAAPTVRAAQDSNVVLQGAAPEFRAGDAKVPAQPAAKPSAKPAQVAWEFSQAFVGYEVGRSSNAADSVFASTATKPLAKALEADPPRLPANAKVPQARVLNVVLGSASKRQVTASVSLLRLRAASELRLTLAKAAGEWRVAQVLA